ncbi:hypothetical protein [Nocardioides sp. Leaf285]|uniref:hypothetical protein n=1 Tax=Nocardioides sp. Leaf285 TaxID=1736322 RepID=UPI00070350B4|nr:hypothetical protein [Nocardioides sp. Leaf285]KQP63025.1 hypothetical protein ASF47_18610 [Nocardioides sp. Leaf285]
MTAPDDGPAAPQTGVVPPCSACGRPAGLYYAECPLCLSYAQGASFTLADYPPGAPEDPLIDGVEMLLAAPLTGGGTEHDLERAHDGDGWNEPYSAHYTCICGEWSLSWVQTDPEQTGRPAGRDVLLSWRAHYEEFISRGSD